jgi:5-methylcytosine-specific restriction endonuclease McrA
MGLRKVGDVSIVPGGFFRRHYEFRAPTMGSRYWYRQVSEEEYERLRESQRYSPQCVLRAEGESWWWYRDEFYIESDSDSAEEAERLLRDRKQKKEQELARLREEMLSPHAIQQARRERIPDDVRTFVWKRDSGRCVQCGSQENLEFDHIIPVVKGGSNTAKNIQLLCEICNRRKSDSV